MNFADLNLLSALDTLEKFSDIFFVIYFAVFAVLAVVMFIKKRKKGVGNWRYEIGTMIAEFTLLGLMVLVDNPSAASAILIMHGLSEIFTSFYN